MVSIKFANSGKPRVNEMRGRLMVTLLAFVPLLSHGSDQVPGIDIGVVTRDESMTGQEFLIDGKFAGFVSDFVRLSPGVHTLEVEGPAGGWQTVTLRASSSNIAIESSDFGSYCVADGKSPYVSEWSSPAIQEDPTHSGAFKIVIAKPFVKQRESPCDVPQQMMARWTVIGAIKLNLTSQPTGAEIIIDRDRVGSSNSESNVPYRNWTEEISVTLRKSGYVNCTWLLHAPFEDSATLHCPFKTPGR